MKIRQWLCSLVLLAMMPWSGAWAINPNSIIDFLVEETYYDTKVTLFIGKPIKSAKIYFLEQSISAFGEFCDPLYSKDMIPIPAMNITNSMVNSGIIGGSIGVSKLASLEGTLSASYTTQATMSKPATYQFTYLGSRAFKIAVLNTDETVEITDWYTKQQQNCPTATTQIPEEFTPIVTGFYVVATDANDNVTGTTASQNGTGTKNFQIAKGQRAKIIITGERLNNYTAVFINDCLSPRQLQPGDGVTQNSTRREFACNVPSNVRSGYKDAGVKTKKGGKVIYFSPGSVKILSNY